MKNALHLLFLLLSFITISCATEDEDEEQPAVPKLRLTKASTFFVNARDPFITYQYTYNDKKLMTDLTTTYRRVSHSYDHHGRLVSAIEEIPSGSSFTNKTTESFSYNAAGWLATANRQYPEDSSNPLIAVTFLHDAQGRIIRVNGATGGATLLTYDAVGNVIKQEGYLTMPSSHQLWLRTYVMEVKYDQKENPFLSLGSPINPVYNTPTQFTRAALWNFISFLSPNNPTELKSTFYEHDGSYQTETIPFSYKYNAEGLPIEIQYKGLVQKLEYIML